METVFLTKATLRKEHEPEVTHNEVVADNVPERSRRLGGPGVDAHVRHESGEAVLHAKFLINEGALVTATADDLLNLWTFRQKLPQRVQSLKFQRERHLEPFHYNNIVFDIVAALPGATREDAIISRYFFAIICMITCLHLPLQSKWIHVGTERGNVHVVNIETFALSGYVINWNKAIEVQPDMVSENKLTNLGETNNKPK
ncbi:jg10616 [Pararge aegeria aegeria]|uniref:Jg10616 protein n=1 Tax=Pararge aegeria aegeria TaxID=348720 RepID=A0A8S4R9Q8_9NEOP|nr:jg10616 [Pararge aegeria aegeria]